jgi:hypothetical protein
MTTRPALPPMEKFVAAKKLRDKNSDISTLKIYILISAETNVPIWRWLRARRLMV